MQDSCAYARIAGRRRRYRAQPGPTRRAAPAVAVVCPEPACAVLACVDGQGPWCGGLEPATNDRAQSAEAVKKAYEAELAKLVTKRPPPEPSDSQDQKK